MPRTHEKGFREVATLTALTLGMLALPHQASASYTVKKTGASIEQASKPEASSRMPKDLRELLHEVTELGTGTTPVDRLIDLPYKKLDRFTVGRSKVRIVQIGGELATGPIKKPELSQIEKDIKMFDKFARSGAVAKMPVFEVDHTNRVVSGREVHFGIKPEKKDKVIFIVPSRLDIGTGIAGTPNVFTESRSKIVASFVRPDMPGGTEGVITELCQSSVNVSLNRSGFFGSSASAAQLDKIQLLGQENVCNPLARAVNDRRAGLSFDQYVGLRSELVKGFTDWPTPNLNTFLITMPYIANKAIYSNIGRIIPKTAANFFKYPLPF